MTYIHGKSIIKIALADDHVMFREAISAMIDGFENCKVVIQAANGRELIEKLEQKSNTDLVFLDVVMPEMDGYDTAIKLHRQFPELRIIFCSMYNNELAICRMIGTGANGFIDKASSLSELKRAIYHVMKKELYPADRTGNILFYHEGGNWHHDLAMYKLSDDELNFLKLVCTEKPYKEIAREMRLTDRQIDYMRENLFYRLDVHSRIGLAIVASQSGVRHLLPA